MTRNALGRGTAVLCALAMLPTGFPQELRTLKVTVVEGDGGFNDIRRRTGHDIVVEVRNDQGVAVPDAKVVFSAPAYGATVLFADGSKTYITNTDVLGQAAARGVKPSATEGRFTIQVTASADGQAGTGVVTQSNTLASGTPPAARARGKKKILVLLLVAGAAVGVGLAFGLSGGDKAAPTVTPGTTLTVGSVSVGGPR